MAFERVKVSAKEVPLAFYSSKFHFFIPNAIQMCLCMFCLNFVYQISNMKARGLEFLTIPDSYYDQLREKLKSAKITVAEDLNTVSPL